MALSHESKIRWTIVMSAGISRQSLQSSRLVPPELRARTTITDMYLDDRGPSGPAISHDDRRFMMIRFATLRRTRARGSAGKLPWSRARCSKPNGACRVL